MCRLRRFSGIRLRECDCACCFVSYWNIFDLKVIVIDVEKVVSGVGRTDHTKLGVQAGSQKVRRRNEGLN